MTLTETAPRPSVTALIVLSLVAAGLWWANVRMMGAMPAMDGMSGGMVGGMSGMDMPKMEMAADWSLGTVLSTAFMWVLMMAAMMLPAMSPVIALYTKLSSKEHSGAPLVLRVGLFTGGYFALWAVISVALALLQLALRDSAFFTMQGTQATLPIAGALMILAGAWQLTAIKDMCLQHCRHPVTFLIGHWREGIAGAFRMGLHHGMFCVGCCVAFMGLMFVFGAMNLIWMAVIAIYFVAEKILPAAETWSRWVGYALIAAGAATLIRALV